MNKASTPYGRTGRGGSPSSPTTRTRRAAGTPDSLKKYVSDGTIKEFVLWKPNDLGYLAGYAAVLAASGKINGSQGQSFTAGKLGSFTVGADKTVLLGRDISRGLKVEMNFKCVT